MSSSGNGFPVRIHSLKIKDEGVELIAKAGRKKPPFWALRVEFNNGSTFLVEFGSIPGVADGKSPEFVSRAGLVNDAGEFLVGMKLGKRGKRGVDRCDFTLFGRKLLSERELLEYFVAILQYFRTNDLPYINGNKEGRISRSTVQNLAIIPSQLKIIAQYKEG